MLGGGALEAQPDWAWGLYSSIFFLVWGLGKVKLSQGTLRNGPGLGFRRLEFGVSSGTIFIYYMP